MITRYSLLDVAALNTFDVFTEHKAEHKSCKSHERRLFLIEVAQELVTPPIKSRLVMTSNFRKSIINALQPCGVKKEAAKPASERQE